MSTEITELHAAAGGQKQKQVGKVGEVITTHRRERKDAKFEQMETVHHI